MPRTILDKTLNDLKYALQGLLVFIASLKASQSPKTALQTTKSMEPTQTPPKPDYLTKMALAIRDYEGSPGDLNYQNNNPGNCRCSAVGYAPKYGDVHCVQTKSGKFAKFPTYELGYEYLYALIRQRIHSFPNWTLIHFFGDPVHGWAPSSDGNDPNHYAIFVAKRMGIGSTEKLANYI